MTVNFNDLKDENKVVKAMQSVFAGPEGELVLQYLCQQGFVYNPTYVRGDVNEMLLNEGARRLVLSICKKVSFTPHALPTNLPTETKE